MITVKATREGLVHHATSIGWRVNTIVPFVALPSRAALRLWVNLRNPANGKTCRALVLDVGPWNTDDDAYVFQPATMFTPHRIGVNRGGIRPQVETSPTDKTGRHDNNAGIDLGEAVWRALGMTDNADISWDFVL